MRPAVLAPVVLSAFLAELRLLLNSDAWRSAVDLVAAALDAVKLNEAIALIWAAGLLPLIYALTGRLSALPGEPIVKRIAVEARPAGPQFVGDTVAAAMLPINNTGLRRERPPPFPTAWAHLCKGEYHLIPYEDIVFEVEATCQSQIVPAKIPEPQRFTNYA